MWTISGPSRTPQRQLGSLSFVGGISTPTRGGGGFLLTHAPVAYTPIREGSGDPFSATRVPPAATDASKKSPELTGIWTVRFDSRLIVSKRGFCGGRGGLGKPSRESAGHIRPPFFGSAVGRVHRLWPPMRQTRLVRPRVGPALAEGLRIPAGFFENRFAQYGAQRRFSRTPSSSPRYHGAMIRRCHDAISATRSPSARG